MNGVHRTRTSTATRRAAWLLLALLAPGGTLARADEPKPGEFSVHDLSVWIVDQGAPVANARANYPSAFPATVNSSRPARTSTTDERAAPMGFMAFYGRGVPELDVDLRIKSGSFLSHWPTSEGLPNRLRWAGGGDVSLVDKLDDPTTLMLVDEEHWFHKARDGDALYVRRGARSERFLAYDAELRLAAPVRLQGGPDSYRIVNVSNHPLRDVLIARKTPQGVRVAWLDELPPAAKPAAAASKPAAVAKPGAGLFDDGPAPKAGQAAAGLFGVPAKPAAADKPKEVAAPAAPAAAGLFGVPGKPAKAAPAKSDAKKGLFGVAGSAPQAAASKPAEESSDDTVPLTGGVEVTLGEPLPVDSPAAREATTGALVERLTAAGLSSREAELFTANYARLLFESEALVVACRLDFVAIDEQLPLSIFPEPAKMVRVPIVVVRHADPQIKNEVADLIAQLGDPRFSVREEAQQRLTALGPLAFDALQKAIQHDDMEIVIRAERILLNQDQKAAGRQGPTKAEAGAPAAAAPRGGIGRAILGLFGK